MHTLNICTSIDLLLLFQLVWERVRERESEREKERKTLAAINKKKSGECEKRE